MKKQLNESDREDLTDEILELVSKFIKTQHNTQQTPVTQVAPSNTVQQPQSLPQMPPLHPMQEYHYDQNTNQTYYTM